MMTTALVILGGILAIFAYAWYAQRRAEVQLQQLLEESEEKFSASQFRCVLIEAGNNACQHAIAYKNRPILLDAAPVLPLKSCNMSACECKFVRMDDRRSGIDRRDNQDPNDKKTRAYMNKRYIKDRRRKSIKEILVSRNLSIN
jgi:hypothetical protein